MLILRVLRLILSVVTILALAILLRYLLLTVPSFPITRFFAFFTNQSNLLVALFFLTDALRRWQGRPLSREFYDRTRGALLLYMTMTTSIYWLFLHQLVELSSSLATVANAFLHTGCLAFLLLDWVWDRPTTRIDKRSSLLWLSYPLLYTLTIMALGSLNTWYPYPFLNIAQLGVKQWAQWTGGMAICVSLLTLVIALLNNKLRRVPAQNSFNV